MTLLKINELKTSYLTLGGEVKAVDGVSFEVNEERRWDLPGNLHVASQP